MIDSYGDRQNPCGFCGGGDDSANNKEYLEFSLCGNNTALFVREVSVDDLTKPQDGESSRDDVSGNTETLTSHKVTLTLAPAKTSTKSNKSRQEVPANSNANTRIDALYTKKWSGNTYFEEEIRKLRDQQYDRDLRDALKRRKLWHSFQIELLRDKRRELIKSSGPEWWQEPSTKQIVLATTLKDVIKADFEEEVTGRTRQWLLDLGVTTRLPPKRVRRCMKRSLLEPVDFLLETHAQVVKAQQNAKKKDGLQRPFSVDERLLLSAVCVLQLPTLLTMLHYMLPPPKPFPVDKHAQEVLYGDLDDETIRYSTPYMEPLPFRNKIDFEDWAFGKICSALLPVLLKDDSTGADLRKSDFSERMTLELRRSMSVGSQHIQNPRLSVISTAPSVAMLISYCLSKRKVTDSMKVNVDADSVGRRKTYDRRLTGLAGKTQSHTKGTRFSKAEHGEALVQSSLKSVLETEPVPAARENASTVRKEKYSSVIAVPAPVTQAGYDEYNWAYQNWQGDYGQVVPANNQYQYQYQYQNQYQYPDQMYYGNNAYDEQYNYYDNETQKSPESKTVSKLKNEEADISKTSSKLTLEVTHSESHEVLRTSQDLEHGEPLHQLKNLWEEIAARPEKEQLHEAIKILMEMGDPLAQLPKIEKLPTIQRWLELRSGKSRILSKKTKKKLLDESRGMWKSVHFGNMTRGPKVEMTKAEERKLTWDRKKWLESEVKKEKRNYFTRIRQEKVDNSRSFFPTMLNHYDYGSRLNRSFRDVYYTYLPAREADTLAYRPWQQQETNVSKM